jgi:hypothetical protein
MGVDELGLVLPARGIYHVRNSRHGLMSSGLRGKIAVSDLKTARLRDSSTLTRGIAELRIRP